MHVTFCSQVFQTTSNILNVDVNIVTRQAYHLFPNFKSSPRAEGNRNTLSRKYTFATEITFLDFQTFSRKNEISPTK